MQNHEPRDPQPTPTPLAVTLPTAKRLSGLGKTMLYALMDKGQLESVTIGRRLIKYASLEALLGK